MNKKKSIKKTGLLSNIIIVVLAFFQLYSIQFTFLPISTRVSLAIIGIFLSVVNLKKNIRALAFANKNFKLYFLFLFLIAAVAFISLIINDSNDFSWVIYPISTFVVLFSAYAGVLIAKKLKPNLSYFDIIDYIILAVLVQQFIAILMYISPAIGTFLTSLQSFDEIAERIVRDSLGGRLIGVGSKGFDAGIVAGFALILIMMRIINLRDHNKVYTKYILAYLIISVLGIMMARTTFIGIIFSFIYLLTSKSSRFKFSILLRFVSVMALSIFLFSVISEIAFPNLNETFSKALSFGFEMFINYSETGQFTSRSTEDLKTMYIFPTSAKTWIIGDGKYMGDARIEEIYYMGTDVGHLRLIFLFGLIGLTTYFVYQWFLIKSVFSLKTSLLFFFFIFVIMFKGYADLSYLLAWFFIYKLFFTNPRKNYRYG